MPRETIRKRPQCTPTENNPVAASPRKPIEEQRRHAVLIPEKHGNVTPRQATHRFISARTLAGLLFGILVTCAPAQTTKENPARVRKRSFDIAYRVDEAALPLESAQLWYTQDEGETWELFGTDDDRQSPITFRPPSEGLFGLFFVLTNASGASSAPPADGTRAHYWAMVDFTPPVVQLHPLRPTTVLGQRVVQVRWTAIDSQLPRRPIRIDYRLPPSKKWEPVSREPLANTGRFDWRIPEGVFGPIAMRVRVSDLGGNRVKSSEQRIDVSKAVTPDVGADRGSASMIGYSSQVDDATIPGSRRARQRVEQLLLEAQQHRKHGDYVRGIARLREAVRLDPQLTDAFMAMASMLATVGDNDRALNAYDIALRQRPGMREALLGSARVLRDQKRYEAAAQRLRTILRYNAKDAETWMNLGDVAVFQGDPMLAREYYTRATRIDPGAEKVIADAKQRLSLMNQSTSSRSVSTD